MGVLVAMAATLATSGALSIADSHERDLRTARLAASAELAEIEAGRQAHKQRIGIANRRARRGPFDKARDRGPRGPSSMVGAVSAPDAEPATAPPAQSAPAPSATAGVDTPETPADPPPSSDPPPAPAPEEEPPAEEPPTQEPPVQQPPAEEPPTQEPPVVEPPAPEPPVVEEPTDDPDKGTAEQPTPPTTPSPAPGAVPLTMAIDGGYTDWSDTEIKERTALGAAVTRHEWDVAAPVDDQDDVMEVAFGTIGTRIHPLLGANELGDPTRYKDFVVAFIRRYGVGGSFWDAHPELDESRFAITSVELGNEPYFGGMTGAEYADAVRPALQEINRLDLPVTVMVPAYVHGEAKPWTEQAVEGLPGLAGLFDGFAFHPYWYGHHPATTGAGGPFERIETMREWMDEQGFGAKRLYLTEYGESTASCGEECVSEAEQATHLAAMLDAIVAHPEWRVAMLSVFQLRDRGTNDPDRERQFGLIRENGTLKPSYAIVKTAMQAFR